nr:MAG TPA: hypothetical protein [Caudoviricetes sp.]
MEKIHLGKKRIVELEINGRKCVAALDNYAIDHFQVTNKKGLLKALEDIQNHNMTSILTLLGSVIRDKKTNKPVGEKYFRQFDTMDIINSLMPVITELIPDNLPQAANEKEKK